MNIASPVGFLCGLAVILFAVNTGINSSVFLDAHAFVIVLGGTISVALIMFPLNYFVRMAKVYFRVVAGQTTQQIKSTIEEIVQISKNMDGGSRLETELPKVKNEFLKESLSLMAQGGLSEEDLEDVLEKRVQIQNEEYKREGATYKILGKFPPAFGLIGATLGMISLLQGLGKADAFKNIGPSMSIALVATFFGLVLANFIIIPVGENITRASQMDLITRRVVVDGVKLIRERKHPLLVEEYLKSYLSPAERNKMKPAS